VFRLVTEKFPFVTELEWLSAPPPEGVVQEKEIFIYALTMAYYKAMEMEYTMEKLDTGVLIPVLQFSGFCRWILLQLWTQPTETAKSLNEILKTTPLLDENFKALLEYKNIPAVCLPKVHPNASSIMARLQENWLIARSPILAASNAKLTDREQWAVNTQQQRSINTAQNTNMMTMASAQATLAAYGALNAGWNVWKQGSGNF